MSQVVLVAPLSGVMVPIEEVPDPVFASKMVGDGVSIDPLSQSLLAPFAGRITQLHSAGHALTVTHESGLEVMMHIGLDTVALKGEGFTPRVKVGDAVTSGQALIDFDADAIAQKVPSLLTQIVITNGDRVARMEPRRGAVAAAVDTVLTVHLKAVETSAPASAGNAVSSALVEVSNPQGLHARPAAVLSGQARAFRSDLELVRGDRRANAKSVTAIMSLEVKKGDQVTFVGRGDDAAAAVEALASALRDGLGEDESHAPAPVSASTTPVAAGAPDEPGVLRGVAASPGLVVGRIFKLRRQRIEVVENAADPAGQRRTLMHAIDQARAELEVLQGRLAAEADATQAAIFAAHREILDDPDLADKVSEALGHGKSAGYAWQQTYLALAEQLGRLSNPLLAQRANDVRDVGERVLRLIVGTVDTPAEVPPESVLLAEDLTPSDTATLDRSRVLGFATLLGGPTSHVAILARSLDLPAIAAMDPRALELADGTLAVLDGNKGVLRVDPPAGEVEEIRKQIAAQAERRKVLQAQAGQAAVTRDGRAIEVAANLGKVEEAQPAVDNGAEGVGLLRSEFLFMGRDTAPSEDEQAEAYASVARALGPTRRLVIRTIDVGGDKPLPYLPIAAEENPFLGERGLRVCLSRPQILRTQLRAILRAASLTKMHVMLPMVTNIDELRRARAIFEEERQAVGAPAVPLGIMIEVPAAALAADALAREADFFSVGTNDLTQYTLAIDRGHPRLAAMADALHPAVLKLIKMAADAAHAHGRWIGVCGGVAADPIAIPILVGLGVDELSVAVPAIPAVKAAVRELDSGPCKALAERAMACESAAAVRALEVK